MQNWERFSEADEEQLAQLVRTRSPAQLVDGLWWVFPHQNPLIEPARVRQIFLDGLTERTPEVRAAFVAEAFEQDMLAGNVAPVVDDLVDRGLTTCSHRDYLAYVTIGVLTGGQHPWYSRADVTPIPPDRIERNERRFQETVLWQLFAVEGAGKHNQFQDWYQSIAEYVLRRPELRERVLDEALRGLLRDFSPTDIMGYLVLLRLLEPTAEEAAARQSLLIHILRTTPGTAVTLAQDLLRSCVPALTELDDLFAASATVATRPEKKQALAHLALLAAIGREHPAASARAAAAAAAFLESRHLQVVEVARAAVGADAAAVTAPAVGETVERPHIPGPRTVPRTAPPAEVAPITDPEELAAVLARLLEESKPAEDVVAAAHAVDRLRGQVPSTASSLLARALDARRGDARPVEVAALVAGWLGAPIPHLHTAEHIWTPDYSQTGWGVDFDPSRIREVKRPYWSPTVLYRQWMDEFARAPRRRPVARTVEEIRTRPPRHEPRWRRMLAAGYNPDYSAPVEPPTDPRFGVLALWVDDAATGVGAAARVFDLRPMIATRFALTMYQTEAHSETRQFDAHLDWWRWLLGHSPDHLAAHAMPALNRAAKHINVSTAAGVDGIAATSVPLGPPSWDALVLASADKSAEGRARAAEALGLLAESGFFVPGSFASATASLVQLKVIPGQRVVATLADAGTISPIAGWRMLETMTALLPDFSGPATPRLLEAIARLAERFGTTVELPPGLAGRTTAATASAIRMITALRNNPTPELAAAAAAARAAAAD